MMSCTSNCPFVWGGIGITTGGCRRCCCNNGNSNSGNANSNNSCGCGC